MPAASGPIPTPPQTVASFEKAEICLRSKSESEEVVARIRSAVRDDATIVLVAYSDASDFKSPPKGPTRKCLKTDRRLPRDLQGHLRVAASRALSVYYLARDAKVPGFDRDFAVVWSPKEVEALQGDAVLILPRRSEGTDAIDRRVDIIVVDPKADVPEDPPVLAEPKPEPVPPPRCEPSPVASNCAASSSVSSTRVSGRSARVVSLSLLAAGATGVGMATGFFAASADQFQTARDTAGTESASLREDGRRYAVGAGVALGVGLGAAIAGIATLAVVKRGDDDNTPASLAFLRRLAHR